MGMASQKGAKIERNWLKREMAARFFKINRVSVNKNNFKKRNY